ncbi:hypothetical protein NDU88_001031 [Pleurodeles waltl]|uniref:Uncharacterized protein n=1 Tax=Pleurodeles waltl TaxID=8319 RepID=A0AAV7VWD7_PLEWA|nr:hypothetical protein NDU88_001031 [Pleurodeles waltl]
MLRLSANGRDEQLLRQSEAPFCSSIVCVRSDRAAHRWLSSSFPRAPRSAGAGNLDCDRQQGFLRCRRPRGAAALSVRGSLLQLPRVCEERPRCAPPAFILLPRCTQECRRWDPGL